MNPIRNHKALDGPCATLIKWYEKINTFSLSLITQGSVLI